MVRFAVSHAQYMCVSCCKSDTGEQKYEEELKSIKDLLNREKLLITPPESDLEKSSDLVEQLDPVVFHLHLCLVMLMLFEEETKQQKAIYL